MAFASEVADKTIRTLEENIEYVERLTGKYLCDYCKNGLRIPVMQSACGHRFCHSCVWDIVESTGSKLCPVGENDCVELSNSTIFPDRGIDKEIGNMLVHCLNDRCTEIIKRRDLLKHLAKCKYHICNCPNRNLGCEATGMYEEIQNHLSEDCLYVRSTCKFCQESYQRGEIDQHELQCKEEQTQCPYTAEGCAFNGNRKELLEHISSEQSLAAHLQMTKKALDTFRNINKKLDNDIRIQTETKDELSRSTKQLSIEIQTVKQEINSTSSNIKFAIEESAERNRTIAYGLKGNGQEWKQMRYYLKQATELEARFENFAESSTANLSHEDKLLIHQNAKTLSLQETTLSDNEVRFRCLETAGYNGTLVWKITNYTQRKQNATNGTTLSIYSQPFYTDGYGYKMCARAYLNGDGMGRGSHVSLYFVVMKGDYDDLLTWPFRQRITMILLDQQDRKRHIQDTFRPDPTSASFQRPTDFMNVASGSPLFVAQSVIERHPYCVNDTVYFMIKVDVRDLNHGSIRL